MAEVVSFGNIVNSLHLVRNDYNEHLKAVPQYEAFLLVESATQSVSDKLQGVAPAMASEVVEALEAVKAKFRQHLTSVPEYRALLAIDKLISDVAIDLGVQAILPAAVETLVAVTKDTASSPSQVELPIADQQALAHVAAIEPQQLQPEEPLHRDATVETTVPVVTQTGVEPEMTAAEALSRVQSALQTAEATFDAQPSEWDAENGSISPALPPNEFGHEAGKAA
jgi:hypothetical protein